MPLITMQFGACSPGAVASFNADQVKHVKPAAFGTLNALQVRAFEGPALKAISNHQWNALPAGAFSAGQLRALPTGTLDKFKPANFGAMPALVFGGIKAKQINAMGARRFRLVVRLRLLRLNLAHSQRSAASS